MTCYTVSFCGEGTIPTPGKTPADVAAYAVERLAARPGRIVANVRDVPALQATFLADRIVAGGPGVGIPQAGSLWVEVE